MGKLEDLEHQLNENTRLILELQEKVRLLELKDEAGRVPIPYPGTPYIPYQPPYQPYWGPYWGAYSSTSSNIILPQSEPKDTDHPADPGWHDDPDVGPDE